MFYGASPGELYKTKIHTSSGRISNSHRVIRPVAVREAAHYNVKYLVSL